MSLKATYIYTDEWGRPIFRKIRREPGRRGPKDMPIEAAKYANDRLYWRGGKGVLDRYQPEWKNKALYNLPVLLYALQRGQPVHFVEGERDTDLVTTMFKVAATTNWQGAKAFTAEQAEWFTRGTSLVHLILDNDDAGHWAGWRRYTRMIEVGVRKKRLGLWLPAGGAGDITERVALVGSSRNALTPVAPSAVEERASTVGAERAGRNYRRSAS